MNRATFRLVLLVSCAHALVHIFELALPSVEQMIGDEFDVDRDRTGMLGTAWRLPFGVGAMLAGWLADRYGSKRLLIIYLLGCIATSVISFWVTSFPVLFTTMFAMGCFASIYHPAGLSLISRTTTAENRPAALGWHGIIGSIGIASAPLIAAVAFSSDGISWRAYYLLLCIPAAAIALLMAFSLTENHEAPAAAGLKTEAAPDEEPRQWKAFGLLVTSGALMGFVYASFMHFLPRYLNTAGIRPSDMSAESFRNLLAGLVLTFGIAGQAFAGRIARPGRLEWLLAVIVFGNVPCLLWMAFAEGPWRLAACCTLALVHFMNQPVYNSLIAQFVPRARRSVGYGFSNMMCFGIGALGPTYAGFTSTDQQTYGGLAIVALMSTGVSLLLWKHVQSSS